LFGELFLDLSVHFSHLSLARKFSIIKIVSLVLREKKKQFYFWNGKKKKEGSKKNPPGSERDAEWRNL